MKKVLFIGSECVPFFSSGGLGDVIGSLPKEINKIGKYEVSVILPLYSAFPDKFRKELCKVCEYTVTLAWRRQYCGIYSLVYEGVTYYFVDNEYYFKRSSLYGSFDDAERYAFFCLACLEFMSNTDYYPDIIHAHDWQSALAVIYLKTKYNTSANYKNIKSLYTIHNIEYQGVYDHSILGDVFGISDINKSIVDYNGMINLTKGAIVCCDILSTVSESYSHEIQTDYFSCGLAPIIRENGYKCVGITNGIDVGYYSTERGGSSSHYTACDISGKIICKKDLQSFFELPISADSPIIAMVSRLTEHKGFDLVKRIIEEVLCSDVQFILLGTGERELENYFLKLNEKFPDKVSVTIDFDKELSKKIYSGADIFLMPSRSEPCGLSQMIAAHYGAVPLVRHVGGLRDTITPFNEESGCGNGFAFYDYNAHELLYEIKKAINFFHRKDVWEKIVKNAMESDFSWKKSAKKYCELYDRILFELAEGTE